MIRSRRRAAMVAVLFFASAAFAQEAPPEGVLDGLFDAPAGDAVVVDTGIDHREAYQAEEKLSLGGFFRVFSGVIAGYRQWPVPADFSKDFDTSAGVVAEAVFVIDARPGSVASIHGEFVTSFSPSNSSFTWGDFSIAEFYCDYTMLDTAYFRAGQFESAWGQGRIFNPGNLMDGSGDGFSVRASVPSFLHGVTTYAYGSGDVTSTADLAYAARLETLVLDTYVAGGLRYKYSDGYSGVVSLKKVVLGADIFVDAVGKYGNDTASFEGLAGFFKEWNSLRLYGEYCVSGGEQGVEDQKLGLALGLKNILDTPLDLGLKLEQSLSDWSGVYITALSWTPLKYITVTIGVPVVYGDVGSYYVDTSFVDAGNADGSKEELEVGLGGYRIGLALSLLMKVPF